MTLNKRMKTRYTARETVQKKMNKTLQLIEDIDKYATVQNDLVEFFALRDALVVRFDKIKALDENLFNIITDQDKSQEDLHSRTKMLMIFNLFQNRNIQS